MLETILTLTMAYLVVMMLISVAMTKPAGTISLMKMVTHYAMTLQDPRCVWNLLHKHVSRYTPDIVEQICGTPKSRFLESL